MRTPDAVYDDLLRFQVELSFDLEQAFFRRSEAWGRAQIILDFGAGCAYYACKLAERYPQKRFVCVEADPARARRALTWSSGHHVEIVAGTRDDLPEDQLFDFVLARHVMSYLSDRESFTTWVRRHSSTRAGVLVVDADDAQFFSYPAVPLLEGGNNKFKDEVRRSGGNRDLRETLAREWAAAGFRHLATYPLLVHSDIVGRRELMHSFMAAVAEHDHGSPLPAPVRDELDAWIHNREAYLQYGLFGALFESVP